MDSLGSRKPSELLAHMLELCPAGKETTKFFAFHFLHHLPQELRIMLGIDDHQEVHELAKKADRLWAIHGHRQHGNVAAVTADSAVNAIRGGHGNRRGRGGPSRPRGGPATAAAARPATTPAAGPAMTPAMLASNPSPAALARDSAGLCFNHWQFSDRAPSCTAPSCTAPCSWQGN